MATHKPIQPMRFLLLTTLFLLISNIINAAPLTLQDIRVRDPFIVADEDTGLYYLYAQKANRLDREDPNNQGVEAYVSKDLVNWSQPQSVLTLPDDFWGRQMVWAPEVHKYQDKYYLFVTFTSHETLRELPESGAPQWKRGTQILRSDNGPLGPFEPISDDSQTPPEQMCLDGSLWVEDGTPYFIYCHEWAEIEDGTIVYAALTDDLSALASEPQTMFTARSLSWCKSMKEVGHKYHGYVTDGNFIYKTKTDELIMIWSTFGPDGYALIQARSESGKIEGPWQQVEPALFTKDGGHGMIFKTFEGQLVIALHQPNGRELERARLFKLEDKGDHLDFSGPFIPQNKVQSKSDIAGYLFAHMTHEDYGRLYYSLSENGLHYEKLNNGKPVLGNEYWGHADIVTGHDGRFYLMGNESTDTGHNSNISIWVSDDLIQWEELTVLAPDVSHLMQNAGNNRGAAKIYYDAPLSTYYITWHTSNGKRTPENGVPYWRGQRTFYVTSQDLKTFSEPKRLFPWNMATIDVILEREGECLYAFLKDEREASAAEPTGKSIRMSWAPSIEGPWSDPGPSISPSYREAPTLYPRPDNNGWYLFYEHYTGVGYELSTAEKLAGPWYTIWNRNYSIPESTRHGCIIELSQEQYDRLKAAF